MPVFIFLGWLVGLLVGSTATALFLAGLAVSLPAVFATLSSLIGPLAALIPAPVLLALTAGFLIVATLLAYIIASVGVGPSIPAGIVFPLPGSVPLAPPIIVAPTPGEFFGRGALIGISAATNTIVLSLLPGAGPVLSIWAFIVISLSAIIFVARNRIYQGFLGWSGWLFPLSWVATSVGLLLFIINFFFALVLFGIGAFAIDFTSGAIESRLGFPGLAAFAGGFCLGNFTFLGAVPPALMPPTRFAISSVSSHEVGHTLNTAAMGGIVLWINTLDQSVITRRRNFAYGEMIAEGHARLLPGTPAASISVRWWF